MKRFLIAFSILFSLTSFPVPEPGLGFHSACLESVERMLQQLTQLQDPGSNVAQMNAAAALVGEFRMEVQPMRGSTSFVKADAEEAWELLDAIEAYAADEDDLAVSFGIDFLVSTFSRMQTKLSKAVQNHR